MRNHCSLSAEDILSQILNDDSYCIFHSTFAACRCQTRRALECGSCRNMDICISELSMALSDTFHLYGRCHRALGCRAPYKCCDLREGMRDVVWTSLIPLAADPRRKPIPRPLGSLRAHVCSRQLSMNRPVRVLPLAPKSLTQNDHQGILQIQ